MGFASSNRTGLYRVKETTWGVTPSNPVLLPFRYTGEALDDGITSEKSKEIRSDRMVSDIVITDASISGEVNAEFSFGSFDDLLESAMMSSWAGAVSASDISTTATGVEGDPGDFNGIVVGQWVRLAGFTNPGNNGYFRVTAVSGDNLTLSPAPAAAEAAVTGSSLSAGGYVRNGLVEQSYTLLRVFEDATTPTRSVFRGMRVGGFTLDMKTAALLEAQFSFVGRNHDFDVAPFPGESYDDASTTDVMNCVTNLQSIRFNDAPLQTEGAMMSLTLELDNQHRGQKGLGVLGNVGVVASQLAVTGTGSQYFEDKSEADRFKNSEAFSFSYVLEDNDGNAYIFTLPRCKYNSFSVNSSQLDSDVMAQTGFEALMDPETKCMIQIDRIPAAQ